MQDFLFGAAYYDEYMPYDRIEEDMQMMKKAGFNVIRIAESTWSTLEPKENVFDFTHIDRMLSAAEKYGMMVIIGIPTYAVPAWLVRLDGTVLVEGRNGRARYGYRQNMDITNPTYLHHAELAIRKLLLHTAGHPNVIGFQVDNETKYYGNTGQHIQAMFKEYLKQKFVTTEAMNQAYGLSYWSNSIADWDDFPDVSDVQNASLGCAFEEFRRKAVTDFLKWQAELVKEYKREDQFITHNLDYDWESIGPWGHHDGRSRGLQSNADHYDIAGNLSLAGVDVYHSSQKHFTGVEISFAGSELYALKHQPYLVLETQAQAFCETVPFPGQAKLQAIANAASGAMGMLYWNWHSIHNGKETYWKGVLSHDFRENPTYLEICEAGAELKRLAPMLNGYEKRNKVALLADNEALTALHWFPVHRDLRYNDVFVKYYKALYEMNVECDIVFAKSLDFERYDLILAPALYSVDEDVTDALRKYVENGGVLLSGFKSFVTDKNIKVSHQVLPSGMNDVFGVTYNQFVRPEDVTVNGVPAEYFMELLTPSTAEAIYYYEHPYWNSYAASCKNRYGKGASYYIGYCPRKEQLKEYIALALKDAGIEKRAEEFPLIIKERCNGKKKLRFVMNFSMEPQAFRVDAEAAGVLSDTIYQKDEQIVLEAWGYVLLCYDNAD